MNMTTIRKNPYAILAVGLFLCASFLIFVQVVRANPSQITSTARATVATTTQASWMTPGTGTTTTPVYDTQQSDGTNETNSGNTFTTDSATLALQVNASSTLSVFNIAFEYSNGSNCGVTPAGCDWYSDTLFGTATTSPVVDLSVTKTMRWQFASSTVGGAGQGLSSLMGINGTNNRSTRVVNVPTPMRYVRAVVSVTGAGGALVEATFIPKKELR